MKFKKLDYKGLLFILIMYLFVLQNVLQHILYYFKYLDEIFSLVSIINSYNYRFCWEYDI